MFCEKIYQYANIMWQFLTRKHLCWSIFLILSIAKFFRENVLIKIVDKENYFTLKTRFFQYQKQVVSCETRFHLHAIFLWHGENKL